MINSSEILVVDLGVFASEDWRRRKQPFQEATMNFLVSRRLWAVWKPPKKDETENETIQ
jgi:hypothetical protein